MHRRLGGGLALSFCLAVSGVALAQDAPVQGRPQAQSDGAAQPSPGSAPGANDAADAAAVQDDTSATGEPVGVTKRADQRKSKWAESRASFSLYTSTATAFEDFEQAYNPYLAQVVSID